MSAAAVDALGLSQGASQIRRYLRLVFPASLVFTAGLVVVAWWYPVPIMVLLAGLVTLNSALQLVAYRMATVNRVDAALLAQAAALWILSLGLSLGGQTLFAIVAGLSLLPVVIAVPYVTIATLLRMVVIGTSIVGVGAIFVITGAVLPIDVPDSTVLPIIGTGMTAVVAAVALSLWHTRSTLDQASAEIEATNRELHESEGSLERKVEERTRDLERSRLELRAARDDALAASRHKSSFLANMSHELRTPLNAIIGFSEVLGEGVFGELEGKQAEYVDDIHESGHRLLTLINDILDLSKIEAGRLELSPALFELSVTCQDALVAMGDRAAHGGVELREELEQLGPVVADERRVKQVLANLLSNAIKYTPEGGEVTLGLRREGGEVEIAVSDTGIGIAAEDQRLIFEAFRQASTTDYTRAHAGAGVGLALTRRLVELHGGRISVESEMGRGSTFRVRLPRGEQVS